MGTGEATQLGIAGVAVLVAVGQLALTLFSGSRVEHVRAQHMANLATAVEALDQDPQGPDAGVVSDLRSDLRIATMQYRVARLTQTSLRLWVAYWLLLLGTVVAVYVSTTTGGSTPAMTSRGSDDGSILVLLLGPLLVHFTAAYATRRRQRPALDAVDPAYLVVDPPGTHGTGAGSSADGAVTGLLGRLARGLWQEDRRARHDLRRRRLQPRLAFWSIRFTSLVTGLITGVALSLTIAALLDRVAPAAPKHLMLDGSVVEVISTSARDAAVLSIVAPAWIVLVSWVTWTMVERPWNIRRTDIRSRGSRRSDGVTASPGWLALGIVASVLGRSPKEPGGPTSPTTP